MVNGEPTSFFSSTLVGGFAKEIFSVLLLFVIVMEALSRMMVETEAWGLVAGFSVGLVHNPSFSVSHLLFMDDTLIFCQRRKGVLISIWRKREGFVGIIFVSQPCASWLVDMVEEASQSQVKVDIAKSYREGNKALMVHGGVNKAGSFLEVAVFAEGGRKGIIWLPEGCGRRRWRPFANELQRMLVSQASVHPIPGTQLKFGLGESISGCHSGHCFAKVLRPVLRCFPLGGW